MIEAYTFRVTRQLKQPKAVDGSFMPGRQFLPIVAINFNQSIFDDLGARGFSAGTLVGPAEIGAGKFNHPSRFI